jgi:hypothetical protein
MFGGLQGLAIVQQGKTLQRHLLVRFILLFSSNVLWLSSEQRP